MASTLELTIQHEQDLVVSASGFVAGNPTASNTQLEQWSKSVHMLERYPELVSLGYVEYVPAPDLPAFATHATASPAGPLAANGTFEITPPGNRSFYCLLAGEITRHGPNTIPAGSDYCATTSTFLAARDSNQAGYQPYTVNGIRGLVIETTMYRGGVAPATVAGRREAFLGLIGTGRGTQGRAGARPGGPSRVLGYLPVSRGLFERRVFERQGPMALSRR